MTKGTSNGAGTLRPGARKVKAEKSPSKRKVSRPGKAAPVPPAAAPDAAASFSDKRIERLRLRRDVQLRAMMYPERGTTLSAALLESQMEEFEETVAELARLKERRKGQPIVPYTVTLDAHASRLVRSILADDPDLTIEDVVNGCVYFNADDDHDGSPQCFKAARHGRLGREVV